MSFEMGLAHLGQQVRGVTVALLGQTPQFLHIALFTGDLDQYVDGVLAAFRGQSPQLVQVTRSPASSTSWATASLSPAAASARSSVSSSSLMNPFCDINVARAGRRPSRWDPSWYCGTVKVCRCHMRRVVVPGRSRAHGGRSSTRAGTCSPRV